MNFFKNFQVFFPHPLYRYGEDKGFLLEKKNIKSHQQKKNLGIQRNEKGKLATTVDEIIPGIVSRCDQWASVHMCLGRIVGNDCAGYQLPCEHV